MIYLVTCVRITKDHKTIFDPSVDTEVFNTYFAALRYLAREKVILINCGFRVWNETPHFRSDIGRECMFHVCAETPCGFVYRYTISRINTKGFH